MGKRGALCVLRWRLTYIGRLKRTLLVVKITTHTNAPTTTTTKHPGMFGFLSENHATRQRRQWEVRTTFNIFFFRLCAHFHIKFPIISFTGAFNENLTGTRVCVVDVGFCGGSAVAATIAMCVWCGDVAAAAVNLSLIYL